MNTQDTFALTRADLGTLIAKQPPKTEFYICMHCDLPHATEKLHLPIMKTVKISKRAALDVAGDLISAEREGKGWRIPGWIYRGGNGYTALYIGC